VHFNKNKKYINKKLLKKEGICAKKRSLLACPNRKQALVLGFKGIYLLFRTL
jgi:hypothetical protein